MRNTDAQADPAAVLAKNTARASALLGLPDAALAQTVGLSVPSVSRVIRGEKTMNPCSKEGELALLLVRVYRSLDALVGADDQRRKTWMTSYNIALSGTPIKLIQNAQGLVAIINYLDGMKAPS